MGERMLLELSVVSNHRKNMKRCLRSCLLWYLDKWPCIRRVICTFWSHLECIQVFNMNRIVVSSLKNGTRNHEAEVIDLCLAA